MTRRNDTRDWTAAQIKRAMGTQSAMYTGDLSTLPSEREKRHDWEGPVQRACWQWARSMWWCDHIRHIAGERANQGERFKLSRMGVTKGWADFELALPNRTHNGLAVELKAINENTGRPSSELSDWQIIRRDQYALWGWQWGLAYNLDQFIAIVRPYIDDLTPEQHERAMAFRQRVLEATSPIDDWGK